MVFPNDIRLATPIRNHDWIFHLCCLSAPTLQRARDLFLVEHEAGGRHRSGGGLKLASTKNVIVKRGNAKGVKSTKVDLESILTGDAQFFQLASGDMVYVKERLF